MGYDAFSPKAPAMPPSLQPLSVSQARRLLLRGQALLGPLPPGGLEGLINQLGFVQLDSINVVARAHHLTLGARIPDLAPGTFEDLAAPGGALFEHWTHDAAAIPVALYPHWKVRFPRSRARILASAWWRERVGEALPALRSHILERIRAEGPLAGKDFEQEGGRRGTSWWGWGPAKAALEFLWHTGELAVTRQGNFQKRYDLPERVLPGPSRLEATDPEAHLAWACSSALERLGVATPRELADYWDAITPTEAAAWCAREAAAGRLQAVALATPEGPRPAFAVAEWQAWAEQEGDPASMRLLGPFDPILRDRARALRLFGFDYRFEAFVPQEKRRFGYYVLPILEGEALVGRLDPKFHRARGVLEIQGLWWEKGIRPGPRRLKRLEAALAGLAQRIGAREIQMPDRICEGPARQAL